MQFIKCEQIIKNRFINSQYGLVCLVLMVLWAVLYSANSYAKTRVDINQGNIDPLPIAVSDLYSDAPYAKLGQDIARVIEADLDRSGLFRSLDKRAFIQSPRELQSLPRFTDWKLIKAQFLISGRVRNDGDEVVLVSVRLWDVIQEKEMLSVEYRAHRSNWRRIAHIIADDFYERLTGEKGYFDTRVVYVSETGSKVNRTKRLAIMDQDGANHIFITDGSDLVLTPRFDPTQQKITYLSYFGRTPKVYILDIASGTQKLVGDFEGMTFAPRFSPDGKKLIMSYAKDGNSEIYEMDLATNKIKRLTNNRAIDTSPSYSPDGKYIVFNSNRNGSAKLFIMDRDGKNVRKLTPRKGLYSTPVWSPRGDLIAFTKQINGKFHIGVIRPDGKGERLLSESFLDESPTWAPNGRVLIFFRQEEGDAGRTRLYSIDLTGYNMRELPTPHDASDPAWSPLNVR